MMRHENVRKRLLIVRNMLQDSVCDDATLKQVIELAVSTLTDILDGDVDKVAKKS